MQLDKYWRRRLRLLAEGSRLWDKHVQLWNYYNLSAVVGDGLTERSGCSAEVVRSFEECATLAAESRLIFVAANKLWVEAILREYGDVKYNWIFRAEDKQSDCVLENGDVYRWEHPRGNFLVKSLVKTIKLLCWVLERV